MHPRPALFASCTVIALLAAAGAAGAAAQTRPPAPAPSSAVNSTPAPAPAPAPADDAVKHAKLTACLSAAKAKKLVGAQKTAFIKGCIATP